MPSLYICSFLQAHLLPSKHQSSLTITGKHRWRTAPPLRPLGLEVKARRKGEGGGGTACGVRAALRGPGKGVGGAMICTVFIFCGAGCFQGFRFSREQRRFSNLPLWHTYHLGHGLLSGLRRLLLLLQRRREEVNQLLQHKHPALN